MSSRSTWRSTASSRGWRPRPGPPLGGAVAILLRLLLAPGVARAQRSVADLLGRPAAPEGAAKTYLEELMLYSYIENSFVGNLRTTGRGDVNELRFYDHDNGYTFNAAEVSLKKDPSERYRLGYLRLASSWRYSSRPTRP